MRILVTGTAGFIGAALAQRLLARGDVVRGFDNHNSYYDPALKEARLARFIDHPNYSHQRADLADAEAVDQAFADFKPQRVVNLAAQAGVRYSISNPRAYVQSNLAGFVNILEGCRHGGVEHLVYASSSSVYGANRKLPFAVEDAVDHPVSLYAASKKANELMAHTYSHLYGIPTTGLRFFTVYGPWGRPDMSPILFADRISRGEPIDVFNHGHHSRDFTYVDDIVEGVIRTLDQPATPDPAYDAELPNPGTSNAPYRVYNIGNDQPVQLLRFIELLEQNLGRSVEKRLLPMQPGDVPDTWADVSALRRDVGYAPSTSIEDGVAKFVEWYREYQGARSE
ncbi:NAD-dependent epimerase [Rhodanobacter sp. FDAARGOS 1247]|uniref:NAD-dependent epimerase n=1 Tax=unclassified Rhodanobacter TaxID=2621553 RepID=UPI0006F8DD67|nr:MULTISPECIES: NAD-dependent epimerase [unclassified Rhodanobacter]KQZ80160.1 capsular biosynthesis protein CpsI [Rhodanobacter sp. Root561]QRP64861.1 NAD-dependent epimerase [Rhodanobacter sp. FDAARGOS 1247]